MDNGAHIVERLEPEVNDIKNEFNILATEWNNPVPAELLKKILTLYDKKLTSNRICLVQIYQQAASLAGLFVPANDEVSRAREDAFITKTWGVIQKYDLLVKEMSSFLESCIHAVDWGKDQVRDDNLRWLEARQHSASREFGGIGILGIQPVLEAVYTELDKAIRTLDPQPATPEELKKTKPAPDPEEIELDPVLLDMEKLNLYTPKIAGPVTKKTTPKRSSDPNDGVPKTPLNPNGPKTGHRKHRLSDGDKGKPHSKRPKTTKAGTWVGGHNEALIANKKFENTIQQAKMNTRVRGQLTPANYSNMMKHHLSDAAAALNFKQYQVDRILRLNARRAFKSAQATPVLASLNPAAQEDEVRAGDSGRGLVGTNFIKERILGGGLTPAERKQPPALPKQRPGLRGGAAPATDLALNAELKKRNIQAAKSVSFSVPSISWRSLDRDADMRVAQAGAVITSPIMCPEEDLTPGLRYRIREAFQEAYREGKPVYRQCEGETDVQELRMLAADALRHINTEQQTVEDWFDLNIDESVNTTKDKTEATMKKRIRTGKSQHTLRQFTDGGMKEPIVAAFKVRMWQVIQVLILSKLFEAEEISMIELIQGEIQRLQGWQLHEKVWREYDDLRHALLGSVANKMVNDTRSRKRTINIARWDVRIKAYQQCISELRKDPDAYDKGPVITNIPSSAPSTAPLPSGTAAAERAKETQPKTPKATPRKTHKAPPSEPSSTAVTDDDSEDGDLTGDDLTDGDLTGGGPSNGESHPRTYQPKGPNPLENNERYLKLLQQNRDVYSKYLDQAIKQNNALDDGDPGNHVLIHNNNIDIMAKQQLIWVLDKDIDAVQKNMDPFAKGVLAAGVDTKWPIPGEDDYWRNTKKIPKKKDLPLEITSIGAGPMPGERPTPGLARVLVGAPDNFGIEPPGQTSTYTDIASSFGPPGAPTAGDWKWLLENRSAFKKSLDPSQLKNDFEWQILYCQRIYEALDKASKEPNNASLQPAEKAKLEKELQDGATKHRNILYSFLRSHGIQNPETFTNDPASFQSGSWANAAADHLMKNTTPASTTQQPPRPSTQQQAGSSAQQTASWSAPPPPGSTMITYTTKPVNPDGLPKLPLEYKARTIEVRYGNLEYANIIEELYDDFETLRKQQPWDVQIYQDKVDKWWLTELLWFFEKALKGFSAKTNNKLLVWKAHMKERIFDGWELIRENELKYPDCPDWDVEHECRQMHMNRLVTYFNRYCGAHVVPFPMVDPDPAYRPSYDTLNDLRFNFSALMEGIGPGSMFFLRTTEGEWIDRLVPVLARIVDEGLPRGDKGWRYGLDAIVRKGWVDIVEQHTDFDEREGRIKAFISETSNALNGLHGKFLIDPTIPAAPGGRRTRRPPATSGAAVVAPPAPQYSREYSFEQLQTNYDDFVAGLWADNNAEERKPRDSHPRTVDLFWVAQLVHDVWARWNRDYKQPLPRDIEQTFTAQYDKLVGQNAGNRAAARSELCRQVADFSNTQLGDPNAFAWVKPPPPEGGYITPPGTVGRSGGGGVGGGERRRRGSSTFRVPSSSPSSSSSSDDEDAGIEGSDAWPDLLWLINETHKAQLAEMTLAQRPTSDGQPGVTGGRPDFPAPVIGKIGGVEVPDL